MKNSELFNFGVVKIGDKTFQVASRWREGFTVPECVIIQEVVADDATEALAS